MPSVFSRAKALLVDVPRHGRLAYCLLRDERVPARHKAAVLVALGVIASPLDFPAWVPVLGELSALPLGILAVRTFIEACPEGVRREHEEALAAKQSVWDRDVRDTLELARDFGTRAFKRVRARLRRTDEYQSVSEV
jgi:uncharacterized membrane protein YkvA (DUF1232 family)